jgi:hypothetical protein
MTSLSKENLHLLRKELTTSVDPSNALRDSVGGRELCDGLWRLFSDSFPSGGTRYWNETSPWRVSWGHFLAPELYSFGEDVFGNQLVLLPQHEEAYLWNHENGECHDLLVSPLELLETVFENGLEWIDFYGDGSLSIARRYGQVPTNSHLHWTTPLILGGQVSFENVSLVERETHLVGHAKLWFQVSGLAAGTEIVSWK